MNTETKDSKEYYKKVDNLNLPVNIYHPRVNNSNNDYVVLCIHGGSFKGIDNDTWNSGPMKHQALYYAHKGFIGVEISYRSIALDNTSVFDLISDCEDAVCYIREKFRNTKKIIAFGDSAGGYFAIQLALSNNISANPDIVIACNPVLDCTNEKWKRIAASDNDLILASPLYNIKKTPVSFLLMHGTRDEVVDVSESIQFNDKMQEVGNKCKLILLENEHHAFILYNYKTPFYSVNKYMEYVDDFLEDLIYQY